MVERIPTARYVSREFATLEAARLWNGVWLAAAPVDRVAKPGGFCTVDLGVADVLLVRAKDGVLRGFHNVCPHRGRRLVDAPCGEAKTLRCGYHWWQWHLDGTLAHVSDRAAFGEGLDTATLDLVPVHVDTWGGLAWVHLGTPEVPLASWVEPVASRLANFDFGDYALVEELTIELPCNWKAAADAFNEAYHLHALHPYIIGAMDEAGTVTEVHGLHAVQKVPLGRPSARLADRRVNEALTHLLKGFGVDPAVLEGDSSKARDAIRSALRAKGGGLEKLTDDELTTAQTWSVFPSCTITVYPTQLITHRFRPAGPDPERCRLDQLLYERTDTNARRPAPAPQAFTPDRKTGQPVLDDDVANLVQVGRGLKSPALTHLTVGDLERRVVLLHEGLDRFLGTDFRRE